MVSEVPALVTNRPTTERGSGTDGRGYLLEERR